MASLIDELISVLNKENIEYEKVLAYATEKTSIIVKGDVTALQEIMSKEQAILDDIANLERKRSEVTKDIADVLNRDVKELTVSRLVELLGTQQNEKEALEKVHTKLKTTIDRLITVNETNKVLINDSLNIIDFEINLYKGLKMAPQTANYGKGTGYSGQYGTVSGGFDAKQ